MEARILAAPKALAPQYFDCRSYLYSLELVAQSKRFAGRNSIADYDVLTQRQWR